LGLGGCSFGGSGNTIRGRSDSTGEAELAGSVIVGFRAEATATVALQGYDSAGALAGVEATAARGTIGIGFARTSDELSARSGGEDRRGGSRADIKESKGKSEERLGVDHSGRGGVTESYSRRTKKVKSKECKVEVKKHQALTDEEVEELVGSRVN